MSTKQVCTICGAEFEGFGNNAAPVSNGRCCDECNKEVVIPARIREISITRAMVKIAREYMGKGDGVKTIPAQALWYLADQFHENDFVSPYGKNRSLTEDLKSQIKADNKLGLSLFFGICLRTTVNRITDESSLNGTGYSFTYDDGEKVTNYFWKN